MLAMAGVLSFHLSPWSLALVDSLNTTFLYLYWVTVPRVVLTHGFGCSSSHSSFQRIFSLNG